jgi:transcriptional repressor NrdR
MKCPFCGHFESSVIDSRLSATGEVTRRRRGCEKCGRRYTTYERVEEVLPTVVKKDGRREMFDRQKLLGGLRVACSKRPVSSQDLDAVVEGIERELAETGEKEIPSTLIGEKVMMRLRGLDEVAYVRFASVYRSFRDIGDFAAELGKLAKEREAH